MQKRSSTAWQAASKWYNESVGEQGHYYHQAFIIKNTLKLLQFSQTEPGYLLDLACGQGVLSRHLPAHISYIGVDAAADLIKAARRFKHPASHEFIHGDVTQPLKLQKNLFTHATLILALQNIEDALSVFKNATQLLVKEGLFVIVINHPHFRIPRQSSWKIDEGNKIQYRRIDRYMSPMKIPIQTHPSQGEKSVQTWSFHHSLADYSRWLFDAGFSIELIEEWCSDKTSEGKMAKMENRSREEFPLFMAIVAQKK